MTIFLGNIRTRLIKLRLSYWLLSSCIISFACDKNPSKDITCEGPIVYICQPDSIFDPCSIFDPELCQGDAGDTATLCHVTEYIDTTFITDAERLALRLTLADSLNPKINDPFIDVSLIQKILHAIQSIYDLRTISHDTIFDLYKIHSFPNPEMSAIALRIDTTITWIRDWDSGIFPTGVTLFDSLIQKHEFKRMPGNFLGWVYLRTNKSLNLRPILHSFLQINGISFAEPSGWVGDGNDIDINMIADTLYLDFNYGYGDCAAGCINRIHWLFRVYGQCHAEFVRSWSRYPY